MYLKRNDFIRSVDGNKIWSKSMAISEIKDLLKRLENEFAKYDFDMDENFIMNARRKTLKEMIEERLQTSGANINELVSESLFNLWEFVADEYPGNAISIIQELGISMEEFETMDDTYRKKGIICLQEKDAILDMIETIMDYIDKNLK